MSTESNSQLNAYKILDGNLCAAVIQEQLGKVVKDLQAKHQLSIALDVLLIGEDPASISYVTGKKKAADRVGIAGTIHRHPASISIEEGLEKLREIQAQPACNGILVQLPLPNAWSKDANATHRVISNIQPAKDVDAFTMENQGYLLSNYPYGPKPCTPMGILAMLKAYKIGTEGKNICVIGRSGIVGNPIRHLLGQKPNPNFNLGLGNATVTQCHSWTKNIRDYCKMSDIVVTAAGVPGLVTADMLNQGGIVIDVGVNRVEDSSKKKGYRLVGDVDFATVAPKCSYITPVPGGVGPMTITMLLYNTIQAACLQNQLDPPKIDWEIIQHKIAAA